jgi:hypothetical protein
MLLLLMLKLEPAAVLNPTEIRNVRRHEDRKGNLVKGHKLDERHGNHE